MDELDGATQKIEKKDISDFGRVGRRGLFMIRSRLKKQLQVRLKVSKLHSLYWPPGGDSSGCIEVYASCVNDEWREDRDHSHVAFLLSLYYIHECARVYEHARACTHTHTGSLTPRRGRFCRLHLSVKMMDGGYEIISAAIQKANEHRQGRRWQTDGEKDGGMERWMDR